MDNNYFLRISMSNTHYNIRVSITTRGSSNKERRIQFKHFASKINDQVVIISFYIYIQDYKYVD